MWTPVEVGPVSEPMPGPAGLLLPRFRRMAKTECSFESREKLLFRF